MKKVLLFVALILALNAVAPATDLFVSQAYADHTEDHESRDRE